MSKTAKLKYAIIENEEFARLNLQKVISSLVPMGELCFTAETVEESILRISTHRDVELIFMDIELDDGNCFEILRQIEVTTPIIFTTAYDEYAIKAFKVNSIDYLLKPISEREVKGALDKFQALRGEVAVDYRRLGEEIATTQPKSRILICDGTNYISISTADIAWFEAEDKYVVLVMNDGRRKLSDLVSLTEVLRVLDPETFHQVSRSTVANIGAIRKVSKYLKGRLRVEMKAGKEERVDLVSAARRDEFLQWMGHF